MNSIDLNEEELKDIKDDIKERVFIENLLSNPIEPFLVLIYKEPSKHTKSKLNNKLINIAVLKIEIHLLKIKQDNDSDNSLENISPEYELNLKDISNDEELPKKTTGILKTEHLTENITKNEFILSQEH